VDPTARFIDIVALPESEIHLDEAALLIASHAHPDLDLDARLVELDALAAAATAPSAGELAAFLFADGRFSGNTIDYGDPRNSYLDDVLERRLGIPITLSLLMIEVGRRRGIPLHGVGMPGHFLVGAGSGEWFDPFHQGVQLDARGCADRFAETQGVAAFHPQFLAPTPPRRILERMLANLQGSLLSRDPAAAAWVLHLRLRMPDVTPAQRAELAELLGHVGHFSEAAREFELLARELPEQSGMQASQAATRLRARAN
jgi:regulator of sirC expression with transglutaminase-like and TPR domain